MERLIQIMNEIRPDIDFETAEGLIDDDILDSFDIISIVSYSLASKRSAGNI